LSSGKSLWLRLLIVVAMVLMAGGVGWSADNLLPNGGFERGEKETGPVGWSGRGVTEEVAGSVDLVTRAYEGRYCMRVECEDEAGVYGAFCQPIEIEAEDGAELLFTCYYRTDGNPAPELSLVTFSEDFLVREWDTPPLQVDAQLISPSRKWKLLAWHFHCLPGLLALPLPARATTGYCAVSPQRGGPTARGQRVAHPLSSRGDLHCRSAGACHKPPQG